MDKMLWIWVAVATGLAWMYFGPTLGKEPFGQTVIRQRQRAVSTRYRTN
jgi:hypothetical protein